MLEGPFPVPVSQSLAWKGVVQGSEVRKVLKFNLIGSLTLTTRQMAVEPLSPSFMFTHSMNITEHPPYARIMLALGTQIWSMTILVLPSCCL